MSNRIAIRHRVQTFGFWRTFLIAVVGFDLLMAAATRVFIDSLTVAQMVGATGIHLALVSAGFLLSAMAVSGKRVWLQWCVWATYAVLFVFPTFGKLRLLSGLP
jgi:hypothetical protein